MSFRAKKSLGQNFLKDPRAIEDIVAAAALKAGEVVLEIGPGTGALTEALLKDGARVVAIEADARAVAELRERFRAELTEGVLSLHHADIREQPFASFVQDPYVLVANIPYYLTGSIIREALSGEHKPLRAVLLVQKEVAERIARSTKESLLSLSVKAYGAPRYVRTVPRGSFAPVPGVDSAILAIDDVSGVRFADREEEQWFFRVLKAGFAARRKQLRGALSELIEREAIEETFTELDIPMDVRGEDLSIETWQVLARRLRRAT